MSETKFKVGDRVRVISLNDAKNDGRYFQIGNVGTIVFLKKTTCYVRFDKPYYCDDGRWYCSYNQLELLDSPKPSSETKTLWAVTFNGDDIKPMPDRETAFKCAHSLNNATLIIASKGGELAPNGWASPCHWDGNAEEHAESIAKFDPNNWLPENAIQAAAAPDMYEAINKFLPKNIECDNPNIKNNKIVPLNIPYGELRALYCALKKARGEA